MVNVISRPKNFGKRKPAPPTESAEQIRLVSWARIHGVPIYSHMNGVNIPFRLRNRAASEGAVKGLPDLFLPITLRTPAGRITCPGLYIEMKRTSGGSVSPEQVLKIAELQAQGYRVEVCKGCDAAIAVIKDYLGIE